MRKKPAVKMSHEEFTLKAIHTLRTGKYLGIHTVFSGFNDAFRIYFDNADPVIATKILAAAGKLTVQPVKGGVVIYDPKEKQLKQLETPNKVLEKILAG